MIYLNFTKTPRNKMTTQELAIKYGVPLPETCKALDWQNETLFCWVYNEKYNTYFLHTTDNAVSFGTVGYIPAPQMHEIAILLPTEIDNYQSMKYVMEFVRNDIKDLNTVCKPLIKGYPMLFELNCFEGTFYLRYFINNNGEKMYSYIKTIFEVEIEHHHYAKAYAELYLKLKENNLLNTQ